MKKLHEIDTLREQIEEEKVKHVQVLEQLSGLTASEAREELLRRVEAEMKDELGQRMIEMEEQFKEDADAKARNIISLPYSVMQPTRLPKLQFRWCPCPQKR